MCNGFFKVFFLALDRPISILKHDVNITKVVSLLDENVPHVVVAKHHVSCLTSIHEVNAAYQVTFLKYELLFNNQHWSQQGAHPTNKVSVIRMLGEIFNFFILLLIDDHSYFYPEVGVQSF